VIVRRAFAFAILVAIALPSGARPAGAANVVKRPPDGTYTYNVMRRGKQLATSQIAWSSDDTGIIMTETATIGTTRVFTQTTFDPATMHERAYKGGSANGGQANATLDDDTVTMTFEGDARSFRIITDTSSIMIDDALVGFAAALPAVVHADTANGITAIVTAIPAASKALVSPISKSPPADVPPEDAGITVIINNIAANIWYDKATLVMDKLEDTKRAIEFDRVRQ